MIYVVCALILFSIALIIKSPKNKYTYYFALMAVGMIMLIFTTIPQWKYDYIDMWLFRLDFKILLKFSANYWKYSDWKYYDLQDFFNIAMIIYMASLQFFVYDLDKNNKLKRYIKKLGFIVFCGAYLWFFNSETAYQIYLKINLSDIESTKKIKMGITALNTLFVSAQTVLILYPSFKMLVVQKKEKFWPKQLQILMFGAYTLIMSVFVCCFFVFGPLKNNYIDFSSDNLLGIRYMFRLNSYHYIILVAVICVFILSMLYIMFKGKFLFAFTKLRKKLLKERWTIDSETREIFHMFKNILFSIDATAKQALLIDSSEEKDEKLNLILKLCEKRINDFFEVTGVSKHTDYAIKPIRVNEFIEDALKRVSLGDVCLEYNYLTKNDVIYADFSSMSEAIVNILKNAVESFENLDRENKVIKINVCDDNDMIAIDIIDNGKGINKKVLKKIYKPLYTTKNRSNNWGVGLAFVYKTVSFHCGHIKVNSVEGEGTCVSIILYKKEAYRLWTK